MNKTKKELYEENIKLREYLNFWLGITDKELDIKKIETEFNKQKKKLKIIKKICIVLAIIFLCASCYLLGMMSL